MSDNGENGAPNAPSDAAPAGAAEHLNIKVTDNNNEVFFKIKRSTKLDKLMTAFCERQGKAINSVRFLFEGQRVQPADTPDSVSFCVPSGLSVSSCGKHQLTSLLRLLTARDARRRHPRGSPRASRWSLLVRRILRTSPRSRVFTPRVLSTRESRGLVWRPDGQHLRQDALWQGKRAEWMIRKHEAHSASPYWKCPAMGVLVACRCVAEGLPGIELGSIWTRG